MADVPETMRDRGLFWRSVPDWPGEGLQRDGFSCRPIAGLGQTLISGDVEAGAALLMPGTAQVGFWGLHEGDGVLVRIARDKALLVSARPLAPDARRHGAGFVASPCDDAYAVLEMSGPSLREVVACATAADPDMGSPSAAILFAGVPALLYRTSPDVARLHVEAPLAAYLRDWLGEAGPL